MNPKTQLRRLVRLEFLITLYQVRVSNYKLLILRKTESPNYMCSYSVKQYQYFLKLTEQKLSRLEAKFKDDYCDYYL